MRTSQRCMRRSAFWQAGDGRVAGSLGAHATEKRCLAAASTDEGPRLGNWRGGGASGASISQWASAHTSTAPRRLRLGLLGERVARIDDSGFARSPPSLLHTPLGRTRTRLPHERPTRCGSMGIQRWRRHFTTIRIYMVLITSTLYFTSCLSTYHVSRSRGLASAPSYYLHPTSEAASNCRK